MSLGRADSTKKEIIKMSKVGLLNLLDLLKGDEAVMTDDNTKSDIATEIVHHLCLLSDIVLYELDPKGKFTEHVINSALAEDGKGKGKGKEGNGVMDQINALVEHMGQVANNLPQGKGKGNK